MEKLRGELEELNERTQREGFWADTGEAKKVMGRRALIEQTVARYEKLEQETRDLLDLVEMAADEHDDSLLQDLAGQTEELDERLRDAELKQLLSGPQDSSDAIVSINPGAGGIDAQDWAEMLMRMYLRWCERRGFRTEVVNLQPADDAGIKDVSFTVQGLYAYGFLRGESGVHRLIRISPFDANARRHTGFSAPGSSPGYGRLPRCSWQMRSAGRRASNSSGSLPLARADR